MDRVVCENVAMVGTNVSGPLANMEEIELHLPFIKILHVFGSFIYSVFINFRCEGKTEKFCFFLER